MLSSRQRITVIGTGCFGASIGLAVPPAARREIMQDVGRLLELNSGVVVTDIGNLKVPATEWASQALPAGASGDAQALRMAALSLKNSPSAIGAFYRRTSRRKGAGTAVFATARKLAAHVYRMLRFGQDYVDEGAKAYEERYRFQRTHYLKSLAKSMGYELAPLAKTGEVSG